MQRLYSSNDKIKKTKCQNLLIFNLQQFYPHPMSLKLFMTLIGCKIPGRHTEQHDVFFGIGNELKHLVPQVKAFWPEALKLHFDAWREVTRVDGHNIRVTEKDQTTIIEPASLHLFFLNLGGYKKDEFEEFHYKMIVVAADKGEAIQKAKETAFFRHTGFKGATSHLDDKYGVDVDDLVEIQEILPFEMKERYTLVIQKDSNDEVEDEIQLGYFKLDKL
jgi:hypothetical protein